MHRRGALLLFALLLVSSLSLTEAAEKKVYVLRVEGVIDPVFVDYVKKGLAEAEKEGAEALILQIDTPGGLDASMRSAIQAILNSSVPVVTYVYPRGSRAASAGSFLLMASHVAAMAPSTNVGAAHPVDMTGAQVSEKITNDAAAYMRSLAEERRRNVSLAVSFVRNSTALSAEEAVRYGIIEIVAADYEDLFSQLDGRAVELPSGRKRLDMGAVERVDFPMSLRERFLHTISNPNIAYLLFLAGVYGIIFEFSNPGALLPGIIGGICLLLALWSFQALSISVAGIGLLLFGLLLFVAEVLSPTHGILTVGGIISLFFGSLFLIDIEKEPFLRISLGVILLMTLLTAAFFTFAVGITIRTQRRPARTGREGMIGLTGRTLEPLEPTGRVRVHGEIWRARAEGGTIGRDKKVQVVGVEELTLVVEEVESW
jgi:membrane-bound serine protease (ClpP class)